VGLRAIEVVRPSLESVFLTLTGRRYNEAALVARSRRGVSGSSSFTSYGLLVATHCR
jgi:hypothetical protein